MRTTNCFRSYCHVFVTILAVLLFTSCEKHEKAQTFEDVFDVSGINTLNQSIESSSSVAGLASIVQDISLTVPDAISVSKLDEICTMLENKMELTDSETDKLLKNDPDALVSVIRRFGELPSEFGDKDMDFTDLQNSSLSQYLLVKRDEPGINYYPDDFYSAVQAYRSYIEKCVIKPLKHVRILKD